MNGSTPAFYWAGFSFRNIRALEQVVLFSIVYCDCSANWPGITDFIISKRVIFRGFAHSVQLSYCKSVTQEILWRDLSYI